MNFYNFKCMAGLYQISINFNGDISPCDDLYERGIIIGSIY
jgi:radical SAM protein with 4Fe4S-binding SPASM domain